VLSLSLSFPFIVLRSKYKSFETSQEGPNYYQILNVTRSSPISLIKKSYRALSLGVHPDKNKSATASDEFQRIQTAYDTLTDSSKRRDYELAGVHGLRESAQTVIDTKYLLMHCIVYYFSSVIFTFLMTFSESSFEAFQVALFGLSVMLLLESLFILKEVSLPASIFPQTTPFELITMLHRLYPAYMNGCRCVMSAFYVNIKERREKILEELANTTKDLTVKCSNISRSMEELVLEVKDMHEKHERASTNSHIFDEEGEVEDEKSLGLIGKYLKQRVEAYKRSKEGKDGSYEKRMQASLKLTENPKVLADFMTKDRQNNVNSFWVVIRNIVLYCLARYLFFKGTNS
jgi:hypothetical protein